MILDFARGSQAEPRGHALAYASSLTEPNAVYAAYLVVPPISIDLAKYMPPMFAEKISLADAESVSAIPLPPVPEKVESVDFVLRLAEARKDDVINLGALDTSNVHHMLSQVSQAAQAYLDLYTTFIKGLGATAEPPPAPDGHRRERRGRAGELHDREREARRDVEAAGGRSATRSKGTTRPWRTRPWPRWRRWGRA